MMGTPNGLRVHWALDFQVVAEMVRRRVLPLQPWLGGHCPINSGVGYQSNFQQGLKKGEKLEGAPSHSV